MSEPPNGRQAQAREAYKKAVKPLANVPKDFPAWITAWEQAIAAGQKKIVAATLQSSDWFEDFTDAVSPVMESWVLAYSITKSEEIDDDTLSYRQVANDFRKAIRSKRPRSGQNSPRDPLGLPLQARKMRLLTRV